MYGIFEQSKDGLVWVATEPTLERAREEADQMDADDVDFYLVLPVAGIRDIDGEGATAKTK